MSNKTYRKIDSNITGLAIAQEATLGELPDGVLPDVVIGNTTTNNPQISGIEISWDQALKRLTIEATTGNNIAGTNVFLAIAKDPTGTSTLDVGDLLLQQAGIGYTERGNPTGALAEWSPDENPASQGVILGAVVDLSGVLTLGDTFRIAFGDSVAQANDTLWIDSTFIDITINAIGTGPVEWFNLEPNEYSDFGAEITTTERNTINPSRQKQKGVVTDLDASGGFQQDLTQNNTQRIMQGFMFADAREKATTSPIKLPYATRTTASLSNNGVVDFSGTIASQFRVNDLIQIRNANENPNNRVGITVSIDDADTITLNDTGNLVTENNSDIIVEAVGHQFSAGATGIVLNQGTMTLTNALDDFTLLGLTPGEWIFLGGDLEEHKFSNNAPGFARVVSVDTDALVIDMVTWPSPQTEAATAGKSIRIYFGTVIRNEKEPELIKCRSYHVERTLGRDSFGTQAEYLKGAVPNEITFNFAATEKLTIDMSFVALDNELRNGTEGTKAGDHYAPPFEDAYNTTSNIYQMAIYVHDDTFVTPGSLFGYVEEGELTINNNVSGLKAIGVLGSFAPNVGNFDVAGELQIYFATVEAVRAVRNNADVGFNVIGTKDNGGFVFDIPLLSLGNGRNEVEVDTPIMLPLEKMGAENEGGYTLMTTWFPYLPNAAMDN